MKLRTALFLTLFPVFLASTGYGKITGEILDEGGKGVPGLEIRFTPLDGGKAESAESKKKGRFFLPDLPRGTYRIDLVEADRFITVAEYRMKRGDGLSVGEGRFEGHPTEGVAGIVVAPQHDVVLTLHTAALDSDVARAQRLSFQAPALNSAVKHFNEGRLDEAIADAQKVAADEPDLGEAHYVLGLSLEKAGRLAEAEAALLRALELDPDRPGIRSVTGEVSMRLAEKLEAAGDPGASAAYARASSSLQSALEKETVSRTLLLSLAASLDRAGDHDALLPVLEKLIATDPTDLSSRLRAASLYSGRGDHDQAMRLLSDIPDTEKKTAITLFNIAVRLEDEGSSDTALLAARRAEEIDPELPHPKRLIAQVLLARGEHEEAAEAIRGYLAVAGEEPEAETFRRILEQISE